MSKEANSRPTQGDAPRHFDDSYVDRFAQAMKDKLAAARAKGRSGWQECPPEELSRMLREHVEKGDPRDVANFCMFLWSLGHGIRKHPATNEPTQGDAPSDADQADYWRGRAIVAERALRELRNDTHPATNEAEQAGERERKLGVHISHCNFGENSGSCKYGDDDCPALSDAFRWIGEAIDRAALQRTEQREQWQTIETAPKDGTLLLLWCKTPPNRKYASPDTNFCIGSYSDNGGAFANDDDWYSIESHEDVWGMGSEMTGPLTETARVKCEPTYWMPLPAAPGITNKEG